MRSFLTVVTLIFFISVVSAQANDTTEGGNITAAELNLTAPTTLWAGIVGWLNGSPIDYFSFVSTQPVNQSDIYTNEPNGSYVLLYNYSMIVTRLPFMPNVSTFTTPVAADFEDGGMFENFTVFAPVNSSLLIDGPDRTFCEPACNYTTFDFYTLPYTAAYITLRQNTIMGVLKFSNGTHEEPLFVCSIDSLIGYDGTFFDFEYMVPTHEDYYFYIYAAGLPPYVEIITPEPITYDTGTIPFTYIMYDDTGIDSCWYILDGTLVNMPVCGPAYILNVGQGTHTLFLYANDTTGNVSSDNVTFRVSITPPSPGAGGPPGTPYWPHVPPPIPPYFSTQENIYVTVDYPQEGVTHFNLTSTVALYSISCFVKGDFEEYTTVEITDILPANGTIFGTITVDMPPNDILDYDKSDRGVMQCVGSISETLTASTVANVFLVLHRPWFEPEEVTLDIFLGEQKEGIIPFLNVGEYNSSAINVSIEFEGAYSPLVRLTDNTKAFQYDEMGLIYFLATIPEDFGIGLYRIPFTIYENGRPRGEGTLVLNVKQPPVFICTVMDLLWTLLIILIGIIVSVYLFRRKLRENMEKMSVQERKEDKWKLYRKPLAYAVVTMLLAVVIWWIAASMFLKCL